MRLRSYRKPKLPPPGARWLLFDSTGDWDGPFDSEYLERSTLEGNPWGIATGTSSPRVFRVTKQRGNLLYMEDGEFRVLLAASNPPIIGWEHAPA